ncbi:unnamed protein product [Lactuca saligna]|uniref:Uncharacterized protein n=1 Tax=Lactuca saligna TaxID=75948 RepID=A0AA35VNN4_LACSI|nr:unnamed protein product [Lactuca saligna]
MASSMSLIPSSSEFTTLQEAYGLTPADGVEFPVAGVVITSPPSGKIVAFDMICWANGIVPDYFVFKFFFRLAATNDKYNFCACRGGHNIVLNSKPPKNWQDKWLWVNQELLVREYHRANALSDVTPKLFPYNQATSDFLSALQVDIDAVSEVLLVGVGISPRWRA